MNETVALIQTLGFPIAVAIACFYFIYKIWNRTADENKAREEKWAETNHKFSETLNKVTDTIIESNRLNAELSQTNRMLVGEIKPSIINIENDVGDIKSRLDKYEGKT